MVLVDSRSGDVIGLCDDVMVDDVLVWSPLYLDAPHPSSITDYH